MQDTKIDRNSPSGHHRATLLGYIFTTKARIDNRKKLALNSTVSPTCPQNMVNFGSLAAEICWRVWVTPAHFNGFCVLAALLHGTLVVGVSQTCGVEQTRCHLYSAGRPSITLGIGPRSSFVLLLSFSLPNLSGRRLDVYHTSTRDVVLVPI